MIRLDLHKPNNISNIFVQQIAPNRSYDKINDRMINDLILTLFTKHLKR